MIDRRAIVRHAVATLAAARDDRRGASAVEFAMIATPFVFTLLMILQMGVYYMAQSALDAGVVAAADQYVTTFYNTAAPTTPTSAQLKTLIASKAGNFVKSGASNFYAEIQPFKNLTLLPVAIGNTINMGGTTDVLAVRAQAPVVSFMPGLSAVLGANGLTVRSSTLVRRQGQ